MAITNVMGFDDTVIRNDRDIPYIEGFPFRWHGGASSLITLSEPVLDDRTVIRTYNTGDINAGTLRALASDVFHKWKDIKTKWYFGYRVRFEAAVAANTLEHGASLTFTQESNPAAVMDSVFSSSELAYYIATDRYVYMEVCLNWKDQKIERWIDGYKQPDKDMSTSLLEAEDFHIVFGCFRGYNNGGFYSRWTDFYFMVDTSSIEGDETPSERLGGALVRHLGVDVIDFTEGWSTSTTMTPKEILNTPMDATTQKRLYPHIVSSIAENPTFVYMAQPDTGRKHRLGRGNILFLQLGLNAHRFDGSTAQLYATPVDGLKNEGEEISLTMFVDGYEGRPIAHYNKTLLGEDWTPENVKQHGLKLYTRSGGV